VPPNYRQQQGAPLLAHERTGMAVLLGVLSAAGVGVGAWAVASAGGPGGARCVSVLVASSTGGGELRHCGQEARVWCAREAVATGSVAAAARAACRRADLLPVR
jgi:hypothetical protein